MASRHYSLNMSEVGDVIDLLWGFEKHNSVNVQLRTETVFQNGRPELVMTMAAWPIDKARSEVWPSALVSVNCSTMNLRTFRDAVTHVLYALDLKLVLDEFDGKTKSG